MSGIPAEVKSWIGQKKYEEWGEFDVEQGYIFTSCSSVQNGNPLFWDEKAAEDLTGGPIAPPTMISVWFRPHYWSPGRTEEAVALQLHFDLNSWIAARVKNLSAGDTGNGTHVAVLLLLGDERHLPIMLTYRSTFCLAIQL